MVFNRVTVVGLLVGALWILFPQGSGAQTAERFYQKAFELSQEGRYLARSFNRSAQGKPVGAFAYRHMGMMTYIGERKALVDLKNFKGRGFATWIFWRSAYLTKLVSMKNKILVLQDWIKTSIFGRDISRF